MRIPKQFTIHGHTITVKEVEKLDDNTFGRYSSVREQIAIAHKVESDGELIALTREQIEHSFWHEVGHAFQWHTRGKYSESEAQCYAGLMIELIKSSDLRIDPKIIQEPSTYEDV